MPFSILFVITHDTGRHLGCYGHDDVASPHLDRVAAEGARFTRYFCTAPQCSPSRGSILTGRFPHANGLMGLVNRGWTLPDHERILPQYLAAAGYETFLFGFQHEKRDLRSLGCCYQWISDRSERPLGERIAPQVADFLRHRKRSDAPFFAMVGFSETHRPFEGYPPADPATVRVPPYLPDLPAVREDLAAFYGAIRAMDAAVGRIVAALDETGWSRDTLFLYTTDHGIPFPRAKCNLYDPGVGTALLMRWPGRIPAGRVVDALLSNVDLLPTLLELVGLPVPDHLHGVSFRALLAGDAPPPRDHVLLEKTWHDRYDPMRALRTERWKYIRNWQEADRYDIPLDIARSPSGQAVLGLPAVPRPQEELYDLEADPWEQENLAGRPETASLQAELRERLFTLLAATGDPLLRGPVPPPDPELQARTPSEATLRGHAAT